MEKVQFGRTGLEVSRIALGGIPIMRISKQEASALVREAVDLGINFIDTANAYGDSEEKIGGGIRGIKRDELVIATKSGAADKKTFTEHLDLSLKQLGVDYVDIYQFHNIGSPAQRDAVFGPGGAAEGMEEAVKAGKVRFPAFSSHSLPLALELAASGRFAVVQFPFNFIDHGADQELIPLAKEKGMGFIAMKPMGGGLLNDAGLSFRYLLQYDSIIPDPGIESAAEIREIVSIVEARQPFSAQDRAAVEKIKAELGGTWCHRCDYCQPCPQGIPISTALTTRSFWKRFSPGRAKVMAGPALEKARTCIECGVCKSRCPYHLEIPRLLKENIAFWDSVQ